MKTKQIVLTALATGIATFALFRYSRQLKLIYNYESGQLIIDRIRNFRFCHEVFIENLVVYLNGEAYKGYDYDEYEHPFDNAIFVDIPDLEEGDLIEVKMKTRCARRVSNWGKMVIV